MNITNEKLFDTLQGMINNEMIDEYANINLLDDVAKNLLDYQLVHVYNMVCSINANKISIDGSDTGTGKTYSSIATCKQLNLIPFVICPKTITDNWVEVCDYFGVKPLAIVNYETIRLGKYYDGDRRKDCPYLDYNADKKEYKWKMPKNTLVIFDEVHKCKNKSTLNGKLLLSTKQLSKALILSATLVDKLESFHIYGYLLNFYKELKQAKNWITGTIREDRGAKRATSSIYKKLYPKFGNRMLIEELGDKFPQSQIVASCYTQTSDIKADIDKYYKIVDGKIKSSKDDNGPAQTLKDINSARMKIELAKIDTIADLAVDYLENNHSVVIFVNFKKTMRSLGEKLKTENFLCGDLDIKERSDVVKKFQDNKINILICITTVYA